MITPLLLVFLGVQQAADPQIAQQTLQRVNQAGQLLVELRQQVGELRQQLGDSRQQVGDLRQLMDRMRVELEPKPTCAADASWQPPVSTRVVDAQTALTALLLSSVSAPAADCLGAEVRLTANYFAENGTFVCSGSVTAVQGANVQNAMFEFRPLNLEYFVKWRDGQTWEKSNFHRLICFDYEGIEDRDPGARARTLRVIATILPKRGGLASAEVTFSLPAPAVPPAGGAPPRIPGRFP